MNAAQRCEYAQYSHEKLLRCKNPPTESEYIEGELVHLCEYHSNIIKRLYERRQKYEKLVEEIRKEQEETRRAIEELREKGEEQAG